MFKKVLSVLFAAALCLVATAGVSASAAEITIPEDCTWIYFDPNYGGNTKVTAFNAGEGVDVGVCPALSDIYGLRITVSAASAPDSCQMVFNCTSNGWGETPIEFTADGDYFTATLTKDGPFTLFKETDEYAQICLKNYGAVDYTLVNAEWLDADGNVLQAYKKASLPKTGVVSAAVFYGIGSLLIGGGVVATKKARKED